MTQDDKIQRAAVIGGGVIGAGWAARFLLNGIDVAFYDPSDSARDRAHAVLAMARQAWARLYPGATVAEGQLIFAPTLEDAVRDADFVQESLPEIETLKRSVLAQIDAVAPVDTLIGSSTSGLLPSRLQADMRHPGRLVVGHPFNPVYLLPLVEICGGDQTTEATRDRAAAFYTRTGMQVLRVRKEIDGFIADRLLEALWREGLWLIEEGVATTSELDDAIRYSAGLRWAFMGTFLTYRLAGGDDGMRHFLHQFGPALKLPWTKLVAPELTDTLIDRIATQSDEQAAGTSIRELEALRDDALVRILNALSQVGPDGYAAGRTLNGFRNARAPADTAIPDPDGPIVSYQGHALDAWIDYNGHMTEHRYLQVFGQATDHVLALIGANEAYVRAGHSFYTVESHIRHLGQVHAGDAVRVCSQILGHDAKRLHLFHTMTGADGTAVATSEHMLIHVDARQGASAPILPAVQAALMAIGDKHAALPRPAGAGGSIGIRPKTS
ncbi:carnitine 3-dehydrogenase [Gluconacetobacter azotocaptans]|uniref:L-carnitine dehydrogenase n=1 Tax=Gluconacetobacter azotocaptans TaxID=142834 RepID=A0A7W4JSK3_9PROT|nr:carnitine 3-dehydrogenase [Gluconacetobacter azotocaptans]MBB2190103.1 carnitine 3-dehydrogenase [Gluconacetobacter azotocaptans]MBM9402919.1 carnitine 3-dehydrogenase [Gluconacetobacter azotocaptans]GBQ26167.1 3-hydroxyacyl-CoA dehydrogenase [Gluconacetobacter azotocaptans DSM 13594]